MTIEERMEQAAALKNSGYNCCQAVVAALQDQTPLSQEQLFALASGFAAGMGTMEGSCGALVGAGMIAGLKLDGKGTIRATRQMADAFRTQCGAVTCKTLKGVQTGQVLCPCEECVRRAVKIYGEIMGIQE